MGEDNNLLLQQEINQNMTVASQQPFALSNEEQAFNRQQQVRGTFNRSNRRRTGQEKKEQQRDTQEWVNKANTDNILHTENMEKSRLAQGWVNNVGQEVISATARNNKASSEHLDTIRENIKNSRESLKKRSCESLTIEQVSLQNRSSSSESIGQRNSKTIEDSRCNDGISGGSNNNSTSNLAVVGGDERKHNDVNNKRSGENNEDNANNKMNDGNKNTFSDKPLVENNKKIDNAKTKSENMSDVGKSKRTYADSTDSLNESTYDLSRSYRSLSMKDPHTAAIDLSNNCRKFYFNHQKAAEAIKQSVRSAKHTRAMEKMEGKPSSRIDNAMDRLRSEMADLMDQDLSLMSQLLKLNDKIEEVKTHVAYKQQQEAFNSQSSCYLSGSEMSDSEFEDNDDSKLDLSQSARDFRIQAMEKVQPQREVVLQRMVPADSRIIVYKKKKSRNGKRRARKSQSRPETEEDTTDESDESDDQGESDSHSDTESTLSQNSSSTINGSDHSVDNADETSDAVDSGIQSPKSPEEPPKPKKGGISQNKRFLNFHKKNTNFTKSVLTGLNVLTMQGHNVPLDKYFVPQGLVYLKQEKSENVFCQFTK